MYVRCDFLLRFLRQMWILNRFVLILRLSNSFVRFRIHAQNHTNLSGTFSKTKSWNHASIYEKKLNREISLLFMRYRRSKFDLKVLTIPINISASVVSDVKLEGPIIPTLQNQRAGTITINGTSYRTQISVYSLNSNYSSWLTLIQR